MPKVAFFDKTMVLLQKVLDLRALNQRTIASNVANADTPGYVPARLEFEEQLRQVANNSFKNKPSSHPAHFPINPANIEEVEARIIRRRENPLPTGDGNEVDINREMLVMAENQLLYETAAQLLKKKIGLLRYVVDQAGK